MRQEKLPSLSSIILEQEVHLTLTELSQACGTHAERIIELVEEGILEPVGNSISQWQFPGISLQRARISLRLQRDLGVNFAGVALALDLMDEVNNLEMQLQCIRRAAIQKK